MTEIFSDGFESGDFSAWTGYSGATVVSDQKHHGSYSAFFDGQYDQCHKDIAGQTLLHFRFYFRTPLTVPASYVTVARLFYGATPTIGVEVQYQQNNIKLICYKPSWHQIIGSQTWQAETWYCIEVSVYVNAFFGWHTCYVDGIVKCNEENVNTSGYDTFTRCALFLSATDTSFYGDCVVIADTYIGQEGGAVLKEVADSLSLSDAILLDKALAVVDSVGLVDGLFKDWNLQVSDLIACFDAVLADKTFSVFDFVSLGEFITAITEMVKHVTDSLSLSDSVGLNKALLIADHVGLVDSVYVNKVLAVSDGVFLVEVVEKSVHGVVRTRVFLVLGDLSVQLTG